MADRVAAEVEADSTVAVEADPTAAAVEVRMAGAVAALTAAVAITNPNIL